jgi:hypothetical protein
MRRLNETKLTKARIRLKNYREGLNDFTLFVKPQLIINLLNY